MAHRIATVLLLYFIGLAIYAARRRTELRERFNIAGAQPKCIRRCRPNAVTGAVALRPGQSFYCGRQIFDARTLRSG